MSVIPITNASFLVGKVLKVSKMGLQQVPCVYVRCRYNDFYEHTKMYFTKFTDLWALDSESKVNVGDTILISKSKLNLLKISSNIEHIVERRIFKYGTIIDPITKSHCFQVENIKNNY